MLTYEPDKRITAEEALNNDFLIHSDKLKVSFSDASVSLKKLRQFKTQSILQRAVLTYFATVDLSREEQQKLQDYFTFFDADNDGKLSEDDLLKGYTKLYSNVARAKQEVDNIMLHLDIKKNGAITFTG